MSYYQYNFSLFNYGRFMCSKRFFLSQPVALSYKIRRILQPFLMILKNQ